MSKNSQKVFSVHFSREMKISIPGVLKVKAKTPEEAKNLAKEMLAEEVDGACCQIDNYDTDALLEQIYEAIRRGNFDGDAYIERVRPPVVVGGKED